MSIPAGWYPDPAGSPQQRWWDGMRWTDQLSAPQNAPVYAAGPVAPAGYQPGQQAGYPAQPQYYGQAGYQQQPYHAQSPYLQQQLTAPPGTSPQTAWIWLVVLVPLLGLLPLLFVDFGHYLNGIVTETVSSPDGGVTSAELALAADPANGISTALTWLSRILCIVFAALDWRALQRRGVVRPFHWAWGFFSLIGLPIVYIIGRDIVARRRTGRWSGAMWVSIAIVVLGVIVSIAAFVWVFGAAYQAASATYGG
ncbi:MAG: DUF2510 domain-containing protein [Microbacteriaceae bacterium]|nr:DUF2510 domain-containing protein [Microbacteriaceae bacterium]